MKHFFFPISIFVLCVALAVFLYHFLQGKEIETVAPRWTSSTDSDISSDFDRQQLVASTTIPEKKKGVAAPIDRADERMTLKPFGLFVSSKQSPVSPERFSGFHTGVDFEVFPEEQDKEVGIGTICNGPLLRRSVASGYGGYAVQSCMIDGQEVTVVYGHLRFDSIKKKPGEILEVGEVFAVLGKGYSKETDGERKHLHLGIVKGKSVNIAGYVANQKALEGWLDYQVLISATSMQE